MEVLNLFDDYVSLKNPLDPTESEKLVADLGNALTGILHVSDLISSYGDETHSRKVSLYPLPSNGSTEMPDKAIECKKISTKFENPVCTSSISVSTPMKLVSAMKGGRGAPLKKLTVSWASDVYDPPATSLSHTVKSYRQHRIKSNRKSSKHKQKGKSVRGSSSSSSSDKKHEKQYRKYAGSPELRPKLSPVTSDDRLFFEDFNKCHSVDSYCGSSFLREQLLGQVHMSVAEAT
ncbi:hypothetical protein GIB67_033128 [Kingdonia uniflora]|uniref:Uncharacterized protein n=1 Tax=Kingdonia uniflora TaxID=39325 RepID=A0A7J7L5L4_9MAGN|nr:hypothetical protein GIB67_040566 [Kingdonia uniflora]KAF6164404.1 hypothetical protein GIB67_033128 [Kingdonia uniflora]